MSPALRLQRLDALAELVASFARPEENQIDDALDALVDATPARALAVFAGDGQLPRAERRLGDAMAADTRALVSALRRVADTVQRERKTWAVRDFGRVEHPDDDFSALLRGTALGLPLSTAGEGLVVVVVFDDPAMLDEETLRFIDTVVGITALALDRHQARSLVPRSSGPIETSRGPELELFSKSIAQELLGPAGALVVQHEELTQIHQRIRALSDPRDSGLADDLSDLGAVAAEMGSVAERLRDTVAGLMTAGAEPATPARLDLGELVLESLGLTRDHLERRGIRLVEAIDAGCFALGRRGSLARVVQNLVAFAAESVAETELPCIGVRVTSDGESAVLEVESNGATRVDETLAQVSKSVSTARRGGGIGLKLAIDVVAAHGGHVEVDARPGGGARLRVVLPAAGTTPERASSNPPSFVPSLLASAERRRILIVDDEPMFSRSIRRALRPHDVRIAGTASEAEIILLDPSYDPDLVVCDVFLPGKNGNALHERVRGARPNVAARFVFVTGGALGKAEAEYLKNSGCATLFKPFDVGGLLSLVTRDASEPTPVRTLSPSDPPSRGR